MGCAGSTPAVTVEKIERRGKNVFAAGGAPEEFNHTKTPLMKKSPEVEEIIRTALSANKLLAGLSDADANVFVEYASLLEFDTGATIIEQGKPGDEFYIIESGTFSISIGGAPESPLDPVIRSFGELALLFNAPRSATIAAASQAKVWALSRDTFRGAVASASAKRREQTTQALAKVHLLESLTKTQLEHVADSCRSEEFAAGTEVFKKGSVGNYFYLVTEGSFEMRDVEGFAGKPPPVKNIGDFFGEKALLSGDTRSGTAVAATKAKALVLSRENFEESVGPLKALVTMSEHRDMLMKIDLLKNLTEVERNNAVRRFMPMTFKKGRVIIKEGMPGDTFFVISEGTVTVTKAASPNFKAEMGPGKFFGELALIHEHDKRSATVTATTEVVCHYLTRKAFQQVVIGDVADMVKATASERMQAASQLKNQVPPKENLETIAVLGAGTFGRVSLVQDKNDKNGVYALKALHKSEIVMHKQEANVMNEKNIMIMCNHPFILRLFGTYKDSHRLYMLLEYCPGGELFTVLHTPTKDGVSAAAAKFYMAGVAMALGYLSDHDIMYRDLKPENMLVDIKGYPKVIDFGFAKVAKGKTYTLCGTPEYMAPEIILGRGYDKGVDWWALGVLLYECLAGYSPFCDPVGMNQQVICQNIVAGKLKFPKSNFSPEAKELCRKLLSMQSANRPGMGPKGGQEMLDDKYFAKYDFAAYTERILKAPWIPNVKGITDASNFDPYEVDNTIDESYVDKGNWDKDF